jgi:glutathione S-transferase
MALIFHERVGLQDRRISPFSWRIRYALAHKRLQPTVVPTRFADVARIRALSGQDLVPIIEHDEQVIHDSWSIACYLEDRFTGAPSLFDGAAGRGACRVVNLWCDTVLGPAMRKQIYVDFIRCIDPGDRAYFRASREARLGTTLEQFGADRDAALPALLAACQPLEQALSEQPFLAGRTPAYVDYVVFSVFQWARIGSPREVLPGAAGVPALRDWRARMVSLYEGLGDRFAGYPRTDMEET